MEMTSNEWRGLASIAGLLLFVAIENLAPFRARIDSRLRHYSTNLFFLCLNALVTLSLSGLLNGTADFMKTKQLGLLQLFPIPFGVNLFLSFLALDLFIYFFHRACHQTDFLWRFHRLHHTDREIDVTTASRFHPGEIFFAIILKIGFIILLGPDPVAFMIFEMILLFAAQFVHSNFTLPEPWENRIRTLLVTPNMHRIHHSDCKEQTNSNYGTIFSFWDQIFKTDVRVSQCGILFGLKDDPPYNKRIDEVR